MNETRAHRLVPLLALAVLSSGCASHREVASVPSGNISVVDGGALPAPNPFDYRANARPFLIGPLDIVDITVFANDDLKVEDAQVDASGRLSFPLIGVVEVAGKSPEEAALLIAQSLRGAYFKDPKVTVTLKETVSQTVAVNGEVKKPGIYPVTSDMTLLKVIARAEGWTEFSKKREVLVFRTVGSKKYGAIFDVRSIERGLYEDPQIFPHDTVVVGDSQAKRNLKNIYTVAPSLLAPLIFLLDSNN